MIGNLLVKFKYSSAFIRKKLVHLNLQILNQCNFQCGICDFWKEPYKSMPQLSLENIKIIEKKIRQLNPMVIAIGGGEPLLHKDIIEICSILSKNNFPIMITNGWFMNKETAKEIWKSGLHEVSVSLDFSDSNKHDRLRGKDGAFDRALQALIDLKESRLYPYQRVHMIATVMKDNINDIENLILLSRKLGVTFLVSSYSPNRGTVGYGKENINYSGKLLELKKKYKEFLSLSGYIARFSESLDPAQGIQNCKAGKNLFNIDCQGNVTFCIDRLDQPVGNIFNDDIFDLKTKLLLNYKNNSCKRCWSSCRGSIETLMYGKNRLKNYYDIYQMTKKIAVK